MLTGVMVADDYRSYEKGRLLLSIYQKKTNETDGMSTLLSATCTDTVVGQITWLLLSR